MANPKAKQRSKKEAYIEAEELLSQREINSSKKSRFSRADLERSGIVLNPKQLELYKGIRNNTLTICQGPAGTSKAQPLTSPVLTPDGWVMMSDIEIGDRVISQDGNSTIVTGIFPQGKKDIWELTFSDGTKVECCSEHLWLTQTENDRNFRKWSKKTNGKRSRFSSPKEGTVKTTMDIVESLTTNRGRINHSIPIVEPVNLNESNIEIDPYIFGCLLGDGCFRNHIGFTSKDFEIINSINELLNEENDIELSYRDNYDYALVKKTKNNKYKRYLEELNLWNKKSEDKFIPNCYKFNSIENRIKLLRGLMDTDGSVSKDGTFVSYSTSSSRLKDDVKELVQSLGGIATDHSPYIPKYEYKDEIKEGKLHYRLTITMNPDINPFSLSRKKDMVVSKTKYKPTRYIVSAKLIGQKEAQCIKVDHPSHLYVTNDYIVTHNTFTACYTALALLADQKIQRIVLTKPIQESGENLGFLPGTIQEKTDPYMKSYFSNFEKIIGKGALEWMRATGEIIVEPLAYMRGTTYDDCIMLMDEAQNSTMTQLMLWVTRLGNNSKAIMMGDISQYDIRRSDSRFLDFINLYKEDEGIFNFAFAADDIVRNKFLINIVNKYEKWKTENDKVVQQEQPWKKKY
jgi:phosphate starvation-inducible protein PhoH